MIRISFLFLIFWSGLSLSASHIGMTVDTFNQKWNDEVSDAAENFNFTLLDKVNITQGKVNRVAQIPLNDSNGIVMTVDKNSNNIKEVTSIFIRKNDDKAAILGALYIDGIIMKIFSPEMSAEKRGTVIKNLVDEMANSDSRKSTFVAKKVTYRMLFSDGAGIWFIVSPNK
ncbi:hypothetical protein V9P72_004093 [Yersinia enterocolitica]